MSEPFKTMLAVGGKKNTLGRVNKVIGIVFEDKSRLNELYECMFNDDAWIRMRAADAFEKVSREHPDWIVTYIDKIQSDLSTSQQPSIQWHMAQIYKQVELNTVQTQRAIAWTETLLSTADIDWIVAANAMETFAHFVRTGHVDTSRLLALLKIQTKHKSNAVVKRSMKIADEFVKNKVTQ